MRILVQRVKSASVYVEGTEKARTGKGLLLFVAVGKDDSDADILHLAKKVINLRVFPDEQGKMNLNIVQAEGTILSVSQFTLYADMRRGNRPGFERSAAPAIAEGFWMKFNGILRESGVEVREGVFGAHMEVDLVNDGPVTIWLDSENA